MTEYTASGTQAICEYLHIQQPDSSAGIEVTVPGVFPYAEVASLVSPGGVARLRRAARAVQQGADRVIGVRPSEADIEIMRMLVNGTPIIDIATEVGCSRRTLFRRLDQLWSLLGVANDREAILMGGQERWL